MTLLPFISIKLTHKDVMDQEGATSSSFPVDEIDTAICEANKLIRPAAACQWVRVVSLTPGSVTVCSETPNAKATGAQAPNSQTMDAQTTAAQTTAAQITLKTGELSEILRHAQKILVSVVTIGPLLDLRIRELNLLRDPLGGYLLDCAGLAALKKAGTLVCRLAEKKALNRKWGVGYHVGPGGTQGWPLKEQAKICSLISLDPIGVKIDAQGGLSPFKTISSLIPIGPGYKRKTVGSTCRYCGRRETCNMGDIRWG